MIRFYFINWVRCYSITFKICFHSCATFTFPRNIHLARVQWTNRRCHCTITQLIYLIKNIYGVVFNMYARAHVNELASDDNFLFFSKFKTSAKYEVMFLREEENVMCVCVCRFGATNRRQYTFRRVALVRINCWDAEMSFVCVSCAACRRCKLNSSSFLTFHYIYGPKKKNKLLNYFCMHNVIWLFSSFSPREY